MVTERNAPNEKPPRPKSLQEFFELVKKMCPDGNHTEEEFLAFILQAFLKPHIKLQYEVERIRIEKEKLNFALPGNTPLNQYWYGIVKYLEHLGIKKEKIAEFNAMMSRGFV